MNMSYCRFENTYKDLEDCYYSLTSKPFSDLSEIEKRYRNELVSLCKDIADEFETEDIDDDNR